jgi:radical SAM protein with 4Fe4S-binding SPASM domain
MTIDLFRKIVRETGEKGARKLLPFLHGESLLVPGVVDYFREARKLAPKVHINLTTNGSRLTPELTEAFLTEDLLDSVIVSIDGGDKETFEGIRLGLDYDEVRSNVLDFIRRRNQMSKSIPTVSIAMVTVDENKHSRGDLEAAWKEADEVRTSVYFNWGGKLDSNGRTPNKINFCERLYHYITILADGRVAMCCFDSEAEYPVGDVTRQSIQEIWNSEAFLQKRRWLYEEDFGHMKICHDCDYLNHPTWMAPLLRMRPRLEQSFPRLVSVAGNAYKRWLTR